MVKFRRYAAQIALCSALAAPVGAAPIAAAAPHAQQPPPTNQQLIDAIKPLTVAGPPFTIVQVVSPRQDWYVVTIKPTTNDQHSLVILERASGPLSVVAGPGGYFGSNSLPDPVHRYLVSVGAA